MLGFKLLATLAAVVATALGRPTEFNSASLRGRSSQDLPVVDLGYELHQAIALESGLYNFSNIRYAAPPLGNLRFRAPVAPKTNRTVIQKGDVGRTCPSADPLWSTDIAPGFVLDYLTGKTFNGSTDISSYPYVPKAQDPRATEDCLFLDVVTPKSIFDNNKKAPVLVWIYGGGYVGGDKSSSNATGLIKRSFTNGGKGIVYVAINYRLGAFGWLAGKDLQADGVANAALYDQRFALEWVKKNIHLFGGDPENITVMGESAGGGSILHQITSYGGNDGPLPFRRAILQSPGWLPVPHQEQQDETLQEFLQLLNVSTIQQARRLPSSKLIAANAYQVATKSAYGSFTYGPVVDGLFVPQPPGQMLIGGQFHHDVEIMVGHNADEGILFTSPDDRVQDAFIQSIQALLDDIIPGMIDYMLSYLYPPVFDGRHGYKDNIGRASQVIADVAFQCNTDYLNRAFDNHTYSYMFSVPPAFHGQDVSYTFYNKPSNSSSSSSSVASVEVAYALQDYVTSFVQTGVPKSRLGPAVFPVHGSDAQLVNLAPANITITRDPTANPRCTWWESTSY